MKRILPISDGNRERMTMDSLVECFPCSHFTSNAYTSPRRRGHGGAQLLLRRRWSTGRAAREEQEGRWWKLMDLSLRQRHGKLARMTMDSSLLNAFSCRHFFSPMPVSWTCSGYNGARLLLPRANKRQGRPRKEEVEEELKSTYATSGNVEDDEDLAELMTHAFDDPKELNKRIQERLEKKGKDMFQPKTGSPTPLTVSFGSSYDPMDGYIWLELYGAPSDEDIDIIGSVIRSWFVLGRLGGFNSLNLQLTEMPVNKNLIYNHEREEEPMPAIFQNISDLEFQDKIGRFWVDMGTSDPLAMDVLINALKEVSSDHVGIKQLIFGGENFGDWQENLVSEEDGCRVYKM